MHPSSQSDDPSLPTTEYQPHHLSRSYRKRGAEDHTIKGSNFTLQRMAEISVLASETPVVDTRGERYREKKSLHEQSVSKVKGWGNTMAGMRSKRLAAASEKARIVELERQKIDIEWAKIKAKDNEDRVARARMLQKFEEPRVRSLHSQLLLSNVLMERDKQLEYKLKRSYADKIHEKEEVLKMRTLHLQGLENDKMDRETRIQKRLEFAEGLKDAVNQKKVVEEELAEKEAARAESVAKDAKAFRDSAKLNFGHKNQLADSIKDTLSKQIKEKRDNMEIRNLSIHEMELSNARFNDMKNVLAEKRKDIINQQSLTRITRSEEVAKWNIKANTEIEQERRKFLDALHRSHGRQDVGRDERRRLEKELFERDKDEFEQRHRAKKMAQAEEVAEMKLRERKEHRLQGEKWKSETTDIAERTKRSLLDIKEQQILQMNLRNAAKQCEMEEGMRYDAKQRASTLKQNDDFDEYAASMIGLWAQQGKNIVPLLHNLQKDKPKVREMSKKTDHFSRLGFIARNVPEPVYPLL